VLAAPGLARAAAPETPQRLAAAWQAAQGYQVGILEHTGGLAIRAALDVPTRAHGLAREPAGTLLAVARRPGDWLLRWSADGRAQAWRWIEPRRAFTGHVLRAGDTVYTTETDLDSGAGLLGVRAAASLEKLDEWPTHGLDPHQLLADARVPGALIIANGGVPTQPETGRLKRGMERMDSSLVRLDAASGELLGQWRLADPRLSLRHLAWNGGLLGISMQAEHDDPHDRAAAPVLALFDGDGLRVVPAPQALAGYGGDIAPLGAGFAVGCPRAQGIACFGADGTWLGLTPLAEACALAATPERVWAGGRQLSLGLAEAAAPVASVLPPIRLDNHWIAL
jgi:hypothetical protein